MNTQLSKWEPFQELRDIQRRLSSVFGGGLVNTNGGELSEAVSAGGDWSPAVDISEDDSEFIVQADLPDVKKEDVKVTLDNGVLTISGERHHESEDKDKKKKFHRIERSYGKYTRSFQLPAAVDASKVEAKFKEGSLSVHLPKSEERKPTEVEVKVH